VSVRWFGVALGIALGVSTVIGFIGVVEFTNTNAFCMSCHQMEPVADEYMVSIHYENRTGVRALCSDCHVPKSWPDKIVRKVTALRELYHAFISRSIDTREDFEANRLRLARVVWRQMEASGSMECRNCHSFEAMDFHLQGKTAATAMEEAEEKGLSCIHCHKGITHEMPDLMAEVREQIAAFKMATNASALHEGEHWALTRKTVYAEHQGAAVSGTLLPGSKIDILDPKPRQGGRVLTSAGYVDQGNLTADKVGLDRVVGEILNQACSECHPPPEPRRHSTDQWEKRIASKRKLGIRSRDEFDLLLAYLGERANRP